MSLGFNCQLGRKKTLNVEMTLTEIVSIIKILEFTGPTGMLNFCMCAKCVNDMEAMHGRLKTMVDVATGGELTRKEAP